MKSSMEKRYGEDIPVRWRIGLDEQKFSRGILKAAIVKGSWVIIHKVTFIFGKWVGIALSVIGNAKVSVSRTTAWLPSFLCLWRKRSCRRRTQCTVSGEAYANTEEGSDGKKQMHVVANKMNQSMTCKDRYAVCMCFLRFAMNGSFLAGNNTMIQRVTQHYS